MSHFAERHTLSDPGLVRSNNEDQVWMNERILAVADGMGGHEKGEVASQIAIDTVREHADALAESAGSADTMRETVEALFTLASERIEAQAAGQAMGTTLVLAVLGPDGHTAYVAHAGDSRAYLKRGEELRLLTRDHNVYNLLLERGVAHDKAYAHPHAEKLTQGLGFGFVQPDLAEVKLGPADTLMLCSDGLCGYVDEGLIADAIDGAGEAVAARLIDAAKAEGAPDNVSVALAKVQARASPTRTLDSRLARLQTLFLFQELTEAELRNVATFLETRRYRANEVVIQEGDEGDDCIVIVRGKADVRKGDIPLTSLAAGHAIGELALTGPWTRSASVVATSPLVAVHFTRQQYDRLAAVRPDIGVKIARALAANVADRLADLTDRIARANQALRGE